MKILATTILIGLCFSSQGQRTLEFIADFERQKTMTLAYIESMPEDKFDFRPTADVRSFSEQMLHAAQGTFNLVSNATGADRRYVDVNLEKDPKYQSKADVLRIVTESFDYAIESVKNLNASSLDQIVARGPFKENRRSWLDKSIEHIVHHRAQCAVYLRLSGVTPPKYELF